MPSRASVWHTITFTYEILRFSLTYSATPAPLTERGFNGKIGESGRPSLSFRLNFAYNSLVEGGSCNDFTNRKYKTG